MAYIECLDLHHGWRKSLKLQLLEYSRMAYSDCSHLHHGWRKFWNYNFLNALEWVILDVNSFTMVEEKFEIVTS